MVLNILVMESKKSLFVRILYFLNPRIPTKGLYFVAALVWFYAGLKLGKISLHIFTTNPQSSWWHYFLGILIYFPFYYYVFFKVSRKHTLRIANKPQKLSCMFSFFDWKSYLIMGFMISMGIMAKKIPGTPQIPLAILYLSLSMSLLSSGIYFLIAGIFNAWIIRKLSNIKK